ncbi:ABC transporter substrate-binding protein [Mycolicibacterium murale]|jgi:TRAP-type transport system periplasmic protein|uniref:ABC transporter substrate-binding protein n=1 Tax=Mycolicibacterium murale TaxID=182220 RepID=A0A7I9WWZ1_9MYCO|nr:TRAP transporter substrate-binding protein [Mycolicibacterium murale]MCV7180956.1 TRAP transporter substrate-binding protein [Mycolicibacterium murale]GFG61928.1 ABC transporter substrate-binding protein [Mycolicibacterium murale]
MIRTTAFKLTALLATTVVASACGFLTGQSNEAGDGSCTEQNLRLATIRAESDPATLGANKFAELIAESTDGRISVQVFPNSQLGDTKAIFAGLSSRQQVDMFYEGISIYPTLDGAKAFTIVSVPFLWDSYDQLTGVLKSDRFAGLLEEAATNSGVRIIAIEGDAEPRALSANRPIPTPQDMQGLKLRIAEAPMPQAFARALGAEPEVIPLADLYLALRQGVADAQENGAITMLNQSLDEVQGYFMPTNYIRDARSWYVNDDWWAGLCDDDKASVTEAATEAGRLNTAEVDKQLRAAEVELAATINVVQPDVEAFRAALDGQFDRFDGDLWPQGLLAEVDELKKQFR